MIKKNFSFSQYGPLVILTLLSLIIFLATENLRAEETTTVVTTTTTTTYDEKTIVPAPTEHHNYVKFDINVKPSFLPNENVNGKIVVENQYTETIDSDFYVKLYLDDRLKEEFLTKVNNLKPGTTTFSFDEFGLSKINNSKASQGRWTVVIYQGGLDPAFSKEAKFKVNSSI